MSNEPMASEGGASIGDDTIVTEVRAVREAIFARAGYDLQEAAGERQPRRVAPREHRDQTRATEQTVAADSRYLDCSLRSHLFDSAAAER